MTALPEIRLAEIADLQMWYPAFGDDFETAYPGMRQAALDSTACIFECRDLWGCQLLLAHIHATAHRLFKFKRGASTSNTTGGDKGKIASMSMGPVSVSYEASTATGMDGDWASTPAGQQFLQIRDELGPVPLAPGGRGCDYDDYGGFCGY